MKKLLILLAVSLPGCCLNAEYVAQDRANYETWAPVIRSYIEKTDLYDEETEKDFEDRLQSWDSWTQAGGETNE